MQLLSIGNSFSQDAHAYLPALARAGGFEVRCVNLYIGGCSLAQHAGNLESGAAAYDYEEDGGPALKQVSLQEALGERAWDVVSLQQASHDSGVWESYHPCLEQIAQAVRTACPGAKLYLHETWAYEVDCTREQFAVYHYNQAEMDMKLQNCYARAAKLMDMPLIRVGEVIRALRSHPALNYARTGRSLCRDGFHLDAAYGRYAAAAVWYETVLGGNIRENPWRPTDAREHLTEVIADTVHAVVQGGECQ